MADQIAGIDAGDVDTGITEYYQTTLW
jgi:hypothetical protein